MIVQKIVLSINQNLSTLITVPYPTVKIYCLARQMTHIQLRLFQTVYNYPVCNANENILSERKAKINLQRLKGTKWDI